MGNIETASTGRIDRATATVTVPRGTRTVTVELRREVGYGFGLTVHWTGLLVLVVLLWVLATLMAAFSTATALVTKDISSFAAIINGINLPLLLLAGVLLPISLGPLWLRVLAHFNPLYYLVVASRALAVGHLSDPVVWQAFAVLVPLCAIVLAWATWVFRRAVS